MNKKILAGASLSFDISAWIDALATPETRARIEGLATPDYVLEVVLPKVLDGAVNKELSLEDLRVLVTYLNNASDPYHIFPIISKRGAPSYLRKAGVEALGNMDDPDAFDELKTCALSCSFTDSWLRNVYAKVFGQALRKLVAKELDKELDNGAGQVEDPILLASLGAIRSSCYVFPAAQVVEELGKLEHPFINDYIGELIGHKRATS